MKIALLIVDMQNVFLQNQIEKLGVGRACEYINYVAEMLRAKDQVVVHSGYGGGGGRREA